MKNALQALETLKEQEIQKSNTCLTLEEYNIAIAEIKEASEEIKQLKDSNAYLNGVIQADKKAYEALIDDTKSMISTAQQRTIYSHMITEVIVKHFGGKNFASNFPDGKKAFDWELKEAILSAAEENIISSIQDVEIVVQFVKNNLDEILPGFDTLNLTIEENNAYFRCVVKNALEGYSR